MSRIITAGVATSYAPTSLQVVQRAAGANMSVDVSIGDGHVVLPSGAKSYWCWTDAATNVAVTASNATNPRVDTVVAWLDQTVTTTGSNNSPGSFKFRIFDGTPAGSPVPVSDATIQSTLGASIGWFKLSTMNILANSTTVTTAVISDARVAISGIPNSPVANSSITNAKINDVSALKIYNPFKIGVYRSAAWTDGNGGFGLVTFDTKTTDTNNNYDTATGRFNITATGFYDLFAFTSSTVTAGNIYSAAFYKNGALLRQGSTGANASINVAQRGVFAGNIPLTAGDFIQVYSFGTGGSGNTGSSATYFDAHLVSTS